MNLGKEVLTSLVRHALSILFGWLVVPLIAHSWLPPDLGARIEGQIGVAATIIVGTLITLITPIAWAVWNKVVFRVKLLIAQRLPASIATTSGTEHADAAVERKAEAMSASTKMRLATNPGTVPIP